MSALNHDVSPVMKPPLSLLLAAIPALAICTVKAIPAIVCVHPKNAAEAWNRVGFNRSVPLDSNAKQLINESQCTTISLKEFRQLELRQFSSLRRIASTKGWLTIQAVEIEGLPMMWIASNYLHSDCKNERTQQSLESDGTIPVLPWQQMPEYANYR